MIIEFIGSTGSGKTTLIAEVQRRLAEQGKAVTSFDLVAKLLGLGRVAHPTIRNIIQDLVGFPFFISSLYQHRSFIVFVLKTLARDRTKPFLALNYLRSIVRKIGTYQIIRRYERDRIVLVDEGTVCSAHLLFVYTRSVYSREDIDKFCSVVPLPELVVCIKASVDNLVQRSLQRSDPPREMRSKKQKLVEQFVNRAANVFDDLTSCKEIRDRSVIVANPTSADDAREAVVERIAKFILYYDPCGEQIRRVPAGRMDQDVVIG